MMRKTISVSEELKHLESLFDKFSELDETGRISALLRSYGVINYSYKVKTQPLSVVIKEVFSFLRQLGVTLFRSGRVPAFLHEWPVLTFMSSRPHLNRMNSLLADRLNGKCNRIYFYSKDDHSESDSNTKWINHSPWVLFEVFSREQVLNALRAFKRYLKKRQLPLIHIVPFSIHLVRQIAAFQTYRTLFRMQTVPFIVCEYDQYNEVAAFLLAAREANIPTYTQTHGLLNSRFAYTPLVAENIFVWGKYHKQLLQSWGVNEANIHVTGAVQYQEVEDLNAERNTLLESYGLGHRVISLATNPMQPAVQAALISFVEGLVTLLPKEWSLVLRPHPSEQMGPYEARLESKGVKVFDNSLMPIQDLLGLSDCVMVWNSAFAVDALVNKIPTVHINLNGIESDGEVIRLVGEKLIPTFSKPSELVEYFKLFDSQSPERFCIPTEDYDKFKQVYCVATGEEAAENINKHLSQHIN